MREKNGLSIDDIKIIEYINEKSPRLLRGGSFYDLPAVVRSADRDGYAPAGRNTDYGFRLCRTYN
jgi:formylglycine-generating enzyme required for sulfatase activity